jgi:hypothetical protein
MRVETELEIIFAQIHAGTKPEELPHDDRHESIATIASQTNGQEAGDE